MKQCILLGLLLVCSTDSFSQDTLWMDNSSYIDLDQGITLVYHRNGTLGKKYILKENDVLRTREWNESGKLIRKSKSGKNRFTKVPYYSRRSYEYSEMGVLRKKTMSKMVGCNHIKRRRRIAYDENGKRMD